MRVAYNNDAHRAGKCINFAQLYLRTLNLKRIGRSYLKLWQFRTPWVIKSHNVDTELV